MTLAPTESGAYGNTRFLLLKHLILSHFQNCSNFFSRCTNEPDPLLSVFWANCNFHIFNSNWPLSRQKVFCPAAKSESCLGWDWDFIIKSFWRNCPLALTVFFFIEGTVQPHIYKVDLPSCLICSFSSNVFPSYRQFSFCLLLYVLK